MIEMLRDILWRDGDIRLVFVRVFFILAILLFIVASLSSCAYDANIVGDRITPREFFLDDGTRCVAVVMYAGEGGGVGISCDWK